MIRESIEVEGRKWIGRIAEVKRERKSTSIRPTSIIYPIQDSLEMLKEEVYMELGINDRVEDVRFDHHNTPFTLLS